MLQKRKYPFISFLNFLMFFLAIMLFSPGGIDLSIKNASPFISLALLIVFSCFSSTAQAVSVGFIVGAFTDSASVGSYCFNTLVLFVLALLANLLSHNVFNRNLKATVTLSVLLIALYYISYWGVFIAFSAVGSGNSVYLLKYALPSVLYTGVFSIPFYFVYKKFEKMKSEN